MKALFLYTEAAPYLLACLRAFARHHGAEVHLVRWPVNDEAPFTSLEGGGLHTHRREAHEAPSLLRLARQLAPDVLFVSGWVDKAYLRTARALRRRGVPTVLCSDTAWRGNARQWANTLLARTWLPRTFSHAWVTGQDQLEYARRLGFPADRIRTGFYCADTDLYLPVGERLLEQRSTRWPHRLLCVARYIPTKGHQVLCDAFASLCDAGQAGDWELWIAGTGELHEQVSCSPSGRHPRIRHLGFKQAEELPEVIAQCGAFVLPSTYEPWGVVVHEQACAAMPLLLSDAVGAAERFLRPGINGSVFKAGDVEALRTALRGIVRHTDAGLRRMGEESFCAGGAYTPVQWAATAASFVIRGTVHADHPRASSG